ncbi:hypothetical protein ACU61D_11395 [Klebsiella aerogenes]
MTKSTITREWLQGRIANMECYGVVGDEALILQAYRMALAAMDSEPVAWAWHHLKQWHVTNDEERARDLAWYGVKVEPLYRHAQPAPELAAIVERLNLSGYEHGGGEVTPQNAAAIVDTLLQQLDDEVQGRNAQPAPVVDADDNFYSWFGREWHENYQHNQYTTAAKQMLGVMAESAWKAGRRAAMLQAEPVTTTNKLGNSPVIPDGYVMVPKEPTAEMQSAGASAIRIETTALNKLWTGNAVFRAMLAAAPQGVK